MKRAALLILSIFFCYSCSYSDSKTITTGTFNVEWLGDGVDDRMPRSETDYQNIATVIDRLDVDVLALQEIENRQALERVMKYLPDYNCYISGTYGDQCLACIYKADENIKVEYIGDYLPLALKGKLRAGMMLRVKKWRTNFLMMIVHFKATSSRIYSETENKDARKLRYEQAMITSLWADSTLKHSKEKDMIILGDFNDYKKPVSDSSNTLLPMCVDRNLVMLTEGAHSCKYKNLKSIDHIFVSKALKKKIRKQSLRTFDFKLIFNDRESRQISDHCPVLLEFKSE